MVTFILMNTRPTTCMTTGMIAAIYSRGMNITIIILVGPIITIIGTFMTLIMTINNITLNLYVIYLFMCAIVVLFPCVHVS
jgi:hypothetical protein